MSRRAGTVRAGDALAAGTTGGRLEEVRRAALMLFARDGYAGTNMTDIAREVNLVAPSLYNHIASKGELLREFCVTAMTELLAAQREALDEADPVSRLRAMTVRQATFSATHPWEIIVTAREFIHLHGAARKEVLDLRHRYERGFRTVIEDGRDAGLFDVQQPKLASYAIIEMGLSVAEWYRESGELSVETVAREHGGFALRIVGFRAEFD